MAMDKYKSNRSGGSVRDRWEEGGWRGGVGWGGSACVERCVLQERMSGQVDLESWRLAVNL